jgi:hypothetical protein
MARRRDDCQYVPPNAGQPLNFDKPYGRSCDDELLARKPPKKPQGWWEPLEGIRAAVGVRPRGDIEG